MKQNSILKPSIRWWNTHWRELVQRLPINTEEKLETKRGLRIFDEMEQAENTIRYIGDRSNANKDAKLATKRSLLYGEYSTKRYEQFLLK